MNKKGQIGIYFILGLFGVYLLFILITIPKALTHRKNIKTFCFEECKDDDKIDYKCAESCINCNPSI